MRLEMEEDTTASTTKPAITIPVVIVESHQHVLEHVHDVLRRQERRWQRQLRNKKKKKVKTATHGNSTNDPSYSLLSSSAGWSMVHFDSHPDLATSTVIPARMFFTPRGHEGSDECSEEKETAEEEEGEDTSQYQTLYEMLDMTSTGIAEWILPLVVAANLRRIEWIKQSFSTQLPMGKHQYHVGVYRGRDRDNRGAQVNSNNIVTSFVDLRPDDRLKVDWYHPYYLDDDSYVSTNQLVLKQPLKLNVKELPSKMKAYMTAATTAADAQLNNEKNKNSNSDDNNGDISRSAGWLLDICLDYFVCCNPYLQELDEACPEVIAVLLDVMNSSSFGESSNNDDDFLCGIIDSESNRNYVVDIATFRSFLVQYLESESELERDDKIDDNDLKENIARFFPGKSFGLVKVLLDKLIQGINGDAKILKLVTETIPNWNMPHSVGTDERLDEQMKLIEQELVLLTRTKYNNNRHPFMVTIARSSLDGFTPPHAVEKLQSDVLSMMERIFCDSNSMSHTCRLEVVKDYGEWEGSTIPDDILR